MELKICANAQVNAPNTLNQLILFNLRKIIINHIENMDIIKVAVPVPIRSLFDYQLPQEIPMTQVQIGARVLVPFGRQTVVGIICKTDQQSDYDPAKIKTIIKLIDQQAVINQHLYQLLHWAAQYYQHPIGDVFSTALPKSLRTEQTLAALTPDCWQITTKGQSWPLLQLNRAKKQATALKHFQQQQQLDPAQVKFHGISSATLQALQKKQLIIKAKSSFTQFDYQKEKNSEQALALNPQQADCVKNITTHLAEFYPSLIEGVTGSGKTEVYLQIIDQVLQHGHQVLVLVPEIGLTPQTLNRFKRRFNTRIDIWHSALNNTEKFSCWQNAQQGQSAIVIGTRSAIFLPFKTLGLIVIDEEHDSSFKQQDNFRYNARDLSIYRAKILNIPIVMGTATPALETLNNALQQDYRHFTLNERISGHQHQYILIDLKGLHLNAGLSQPLIERINQHLEEHQQVMIFLNRRGFAPAIICHECGWLAECNNCTAFYTYHKHLNQLICHHCGSKQPIPKQCHQCGSTNIHHTGQGTEQVEEALRVHYPDIEISRLDRDSTRRKGSFEQHINAINQPGRRIIIGTQMIAKGHHFPNVTLVAILDIDGALFSADFRASEKLAQLLTQVAGRAGRGTKAGEVVLQTHLPENPLLQSLINHGYSFFARQLLIERHLAMLPPFTRQVMFRAQSTEPDQAQQLLQEIKSLLNPYTNSIEMLGPLPAPMEKKAGDYRFILLIQCKTKGKLQGIIYAAIPTITKLPLSHKIRWNIDFDPLDMS